MKVYNVKVYDINEYIIGGNLHLATIRKLDKIMVVKKIFFVREIITNKPIFIYDNNYIRTKEHIKYIKKYGYILGINKNNLVDKNIATVNDLEKYKYFFIWSNYRRFVKDHTSRTNINNRIEKIKAKIK